MPCRRQAARGACCFRRCRRPRPRTRPTTQREQAASPGGRPAGTSAATALTPRGSNGERQPVNTDGARRRRRGRVQALPCQSRGKLCHWPAGGRSRHAGSPKDGEGRVRGRAGAFPRLLRLSSGTWWVPAWARRIFYWACLSIRHLPRQAVIAFAAARQHIQAFVLIGEEAPSS
jgi:hypothetical protein